MLVEDTVKAHPHLPDSALAPVHLLGILTIMSTTVDLVDPGAAIHPAMVTWRQAETDAPDDEAAARGETERAESTTNLLRRALRVVVERQAGRRHSCAVPQSTGSRSGRLHRPPVANSCPRRRPHIQGVKWLAIHIASRPMIRTVPAAAVSGSSERQSSASSP